MTPVTDYDREKAIEASTVALISLDSETGAEEAARSVLDALSTLGWAPASKPITPTEEALARAIFAADPENEGMDYESCKRSPHERLHEWADNADKSARALLASDLFESRAQVQAEMAERLLSDEAVEAAATAIDPAPWRSGHPASKARQADIRGTARAALTAALSAITKEQS